ncbi:MAG: hypothetical protein KJ574_03175 [Nanoarchaeota archaeon]|nr:hypothetical protein [Nanoarchaeota archaeon]
MDKRISLVILLLFSLIIISGCGFGRKATDEPTTPFIPTGTEGIVLSFVPNQPPARIYTGSEFSVLAEVKNRGTFDVPNVDIFISGFDPSIIRVGTGRKTVTNINSKSPFNPEGDIDTVEFSTSSPITLSGTPSYKPNIMLSACYLYQTLASPMACVDARPQYTAEDKACTVTNLQTGGSQGAPIAITSIEAQATPSDMVFRIHVSNVGGGQVFDKDKMSNCPFLLEYSDLDKIYLAEQPTLGGTLRVSEPCKPDNPIRLVNGQATIFCKFPQETGKAAYQTPLNIKLVYGYKNSIQKQIEIQNLQQ